MQTQSVNIKDESTNAKMHGPWGNKKTIPST